MTEFTVTLDDESVRTELESKVYGPMVAMTAMAMETFNSHNQVIDIKLNVNFNYKSLFALYRALAWDALLLKDYTRYSDFRRETFLLRKLAYRIVLGD